MSEYLRQQGLMISADGEVISVQEHLAEERNIAELVEMAAGLSDAEKTQLQQEPKLLEKIDAYRELLFQLPEVKAMLNMLVCAIFTDIYFEHFVLIKTTFPEEVVSIFGLVVLLGQLMTVVSLIKIAYKFGARTDLIVLRAQLLKLNGEVNISHQVSQKRAAKLLKKRSVDDEEVARLSEALSRLNDISA